MKTPPVGELPKVIHCCALFSILKVGGTFRILGNVLRKESVTVASYGVRHWNFNSITNELVEFTND